MGSVEMMWGGEALVTNWKSLRGSDGSFYKLWVRADGRRSSSGKRETWHQLLTGLQLDLQQNHDTVDRVIGGRKWEKYIDGLDTNDIQTDTATQPVWAIAVF